MANNSFGKPRVVGKPPGEGHDSSAHASARGPRSHQTAALQQLYGPRGGKYVVGASGKKRYEDGSRTPRPAGECVKCDNEGSHDGDHVAPGME